MTKKSQARRARDEFKQKNTAWDDLRNIYTENQSKLNAVVLSVTSFFDIENITSFVPPEQRAYVSGVVEALASDMRIFQTRLNDIYRKHKDQKGHFEFNDTDFVRMISIGDEYIQFGLDYETILEPVYRQALALIQSITENVDRVASGEGDAQTPAQEESAA